MKNRRCAQWLWVERVILCADFDRRQHNRRRFADARFAAVCANLRRSWVYNLHLGAASEWTEWRNNWYTIGFYDKWLKGRSAQNTPQDTTLARAHQESWSPTNIHAIVIFISTSGRKCVLYMTCRAVYWFFVVGCVGCVGIKNNWWPGIKTRPLLTGRYLGNIFISTRFAYGAAIILITFLFTMWAREKERESEDNPRVAISFIQKRAPSMTLLLNIQSYSHHCRAAHVCAHYHSRVRRGETVSFYMCESSRIITWAPLRRASRSFMRTLERCPPNANARIACAGIYSDPKCDAW